MEPALRIDGPELRICDLGHRRVLQSEEGRVKRLVCMVGVFNEAESYSRMMEALANRDKWLETIIALKETGLKKLPEGNLRISRNGNRMRYYVRTESGRENERYIPAKEAALAYQLAQKDYDKRLIQQAIEERRMVDKLYKFCADHSPEILYNKLSDSRKSLVTPIRLSDEQFVADWMGQEYKKKGFPLDYPEYYSVSGERVRSKSEVIIADRLSHSHVPYKYECPIELAGGIILYPDFTALNVRRREILFWEHLGMMGDEKYRENAFRKIDLYISCGIMPGKQLILTFETEHYPLNFNTVDRIIKGYLL